MMTTRRHRHRRLIGQARTEPAAVACGFSSPHLRTKADGQGKRRVEHRPAVFVLVEARRGAVEDDVNAGDLVSGMHGDRVLLCRKIEARFVLVPELWRSWDGNGRV